MAYENLDYEIKKRMPLWWQEDTFLEPVNRYTQELIKDIVGGFLGNLGVIQPVQVWKKLPTEYSWIHEYITDDPLLSDNILRPNSPITAQMPNSKRNCHGVIELQLTGNYKGLQKPLGKLTIKNANQQIVINNITTTSSIKIFTENGNILVDGVNRNDLVTGSFNKIYSQAKNTNYEELDVEDENKITYISIESDTEVSFNLKVKLIHPIYVTEQHIRVHTVSAFPIESVKLYGFYCHDFNNKQEWKFLWEKTYDEDDRVVFDRITKQFDCERFYIQLKLHGIGVPLVYGFPQEEFPSNVAFATNKRLDQWGKIYGLPRRYYKTHISDDEEPFTYPPYYKYNIEQDYWYEQRMANEYRYNEDAINAAYIKDTNLNNIAMLQLIDPMMRDIYVYTETISPSIDNSRQTYPINPSFVSESGDGQTWANQHQIANSNYVAAETNLKAKTSESFNSKEYQTRILEVTFDVPELPKNIKITGIQLNLNGIASVHSESLELDDRSKMLLPVIKADANYQVSKTIDSIPINIESKSWNREQGVYTIGGENILFGVPEIKREQVQDGLTFNVAFTNNNDFLDAKIILYGAQLILYYEVIESEYDINVEFDKKEIVLNSDKQEINMKITLKNTGTIPVTDKNVYIAIPPQLQITNKEFPTFDLDINEVFVIGETEQDEIIITPAEDQLTGLYDIIVFCDDTVIKNEITVRSGLNVTE